MIKVLYATGTGAESCTYTNERQLGRALLPDRFESTSVPVFPTPSVLELGVSDHYDLPLLTDTPVFEVVPGGE
jgi:hypothetical protein